MARVVCEDLLTCPPLSRADTTPLSGWLAEADDGRKLSHCGGGVEGLIPQFKI